VESVPQFTRDEYVLTLDDAFLDFGDYPFSNLVLIFVDVSTVDMPIADVNGIFIRLRHLTWSRLENRKRLLLKISKVAVGKNFLPQIDILSLANT
jgi:hypothetical protein